MKRLRAIAEKSLRDKIRIAENRDKSQIHYWSDGDGKRRREWNNYVNRMGRDILDQTAGGKTHRSQETSPPSK